MKKMALGLFSVILLGGLVGCGSSGGGSSTGTVDSTEDKGLEVIGENVTYDPNKLVNDGQPIALEYWTWGENDPAIAMAEEYQEIYPNVTIKVVNNPWDDYWTKLPLSLKGKDGPAVFNIHNSQHDLILNYLQPYDIELADLEADYTGVEPHVIDDEVYYIDSVINTGNIYYNKDLWTEAGLTDADIPTTWAEFVEVAKTLTKADGGKITQAGFNWNGPDYSAIYQGLNYQNGTLLFNEDNSVNYDNETTAENLQFLIDLYDVEKVGSTDFGADSKQSFGNGQTAMVYSWGHFKADLASKYPDVDYGVFATPTPTEEVPFAYDRYNGESTPGINKNQSAEQIAVAQDFVRYLLANDDYIKKAAMAYASFPAKNTLADDEDILNDPVLSAIAPRVDRLIWPGAFPATIETTATETMEDVVFNGAEIEDALAAGQAKMENDMKDTNFTSLESSYEFYSEAK